MTSLLDAALHYASLGIPVFPVWWVEEGSCACAASCDSPGKHPLTASGFKDATLSPATVRRWWGRYPKAHVAGVCGAESGLVVLDVDPRHGGDESLAALVADHGSLPEGPRSKTGGGGAHYFFRHPGGRVPPAVGFRPGLDLRGDGSYVLLPPSGHVSGGIYEWVVSMETKAPLPPPWILKLAAEGNPESKAKTAPGDRSPIPEGRRNDTLFRFAARLRWAGAGHEAILVELRRQNAARCRPPLPDAELESLARNVVHRYAPGGDEGPPPDGGEDLDIHHAYERFQRDQRRQVLIREEDRWA